MGRAHVPLLSFFFLALLSEAILGELNEWGRGRAEAAMEGRGGGGGTRSSGKGSAGKIMSLQEFVSTMAPLIDLEKVSSPALFSSSPLARSELGMGIAMTECGLVSRRRRYRRSRRRAPRGWRGEAPSCPTSSAPMPRLVVWLNCCLMRTYWPWC
jgi:hypothetical protein